MTDATPLTAADHTARVLSGFLYADGSADLDPSFEIPGEAEFPTVEDDPDGTPQATLLVEYGDSTRSLPVGVSFDPPHVNATVEKQPFTVRVPDDGELTAATLVDADTGEELDAYRDTGWELESATVDTPDSFTREEAQPIEVDVSADADGPLYRQLFYSPDGETWHPYANQFREGAPAIRFTREAGGTAAQFMLLVSDGIRTESVTSDQFEVPALGPTVEIPRGFRTVTETVEEGDGTDSTSSDAGGTPLDVETETERVDRTVTTQVGKQASLTVRATDERGRELPPTDVEWTLRGPSGDGIDINGQSVGDTVTHQFRAPGTCVLEVYGTDSRTGETASDSVEVVVDPPPLPDVSDLVGGATPADGLDSPNTAPDPTVPNVTVDAPGFGVGTALAALGSVAYLAKERLTPDDED